MHRPTRLRLTELNPHFSCVLCGGYFVDATTIIECLHSFCRACIVRYLETSRFCPICDVQVHKTKPLLSIRSDKTLQDVVYKLVPGLYQNEMKRRREFYGEHPEAALNCTSEEKGEAANQRFIYTPDETISLSLEYGDGESDTRASSSTDTTGAEEMDSQRRYLQCPAALTIKHLKKFITMKYGLPACYMVDITYSDDALNDAYTLMDIAYIYAWRRSGPMRFFYNFSERPLKRRKLFHPPTETESTEIKMQNVPSEVMPPPPVPPSPGESREQLLLLPNAEEKSKPIKSMEKTSSETPCILPENDKQHQPCSVEPLSKPSTSDVSLPPPPAQSPSISAISISEALTTASKLECTVTASITKTTETKQPSSENLPKTTISLPTITLKIDEHSTVISQKKEETKSILSTELTSKDSIVPVAAAVERKTLDIPTELPVKHTDIVDLSDNDDLGCQPDLVVDEQKMDSSDDGEGDDDDVALRKKIKAIAEKEDEAEATDDTEADSGRASDISSQARSSCDDDIGSPISAVRTPDADRTVPVTSALSPLPPTFSPSVPAPAPTPAPPTTAVTTTTTATTVVENHRHSKPNGIAHIINNLHRYHEPKKDNIGALDLSPSYRQTGQERPPRPRPRPVANPPVLDNKHRLPTCLPAPTKQHTSCVPAPKHHSSSSSHHSLPSPSSTSSSSATTSVPSTPTYKLVPPSIPIYKKSDSYRNSHHRFKGSNLTVINPDPNSYRPKIVIKNLDPRPSNHSHHHHHHHHRV